MATSSIANALNSKLRLTGMVSGLDTDSIIKQLMAAETAKLDKLNQQKQLAEWRTDAYRDITSTLQSFYNTYFDPISPTNLKSANSFVSFSASYASSTSTDYISITPNADAKAGTYSITNITTAKQASISGGNVNRAVEGIEILDTSVSGINSTNNNNGFSFTLNGKTVQFTLNDAGAFTTVAELQAELQNKINDAFGAGKINVAFTPNGTNDGGKLSLSSVRATDTFSIGSTGTANTALGFANSNLSNKVDLKAKLADIKNSFVTPLNASGTANDIEFTINGKTFSFDSTVTSINDIINKVNSDSDAKANIKYDVTSNSFKIESRDTGATAKVDVSDQTGNLMQVLGISGSDYGSDASVTVNGVEIVRSTNNFTYDGLTFDLKQDFSSVADPIKVSVASDTTRSFDIIKGFVDKYNEMIDLLNKKISEKTDKDYPPLTDEQKSAMTQDQIDKWEAKAKEGLLSDDSIVSGTLLKLRTALYESVDGLSLWSIGITTSSDYRQNGKLIIDEAKLKDALANKPTEVENLFTKSSNISYYTAINDPAAKTQRYQESGLAQKFSDIIQDAVRTNTDSNGNKGSLVMKAGVVGDRSEFSNILYKQITDFDELIADMNEKLTTKENALYAKFAAMETALSNMNAQQSWLTSQLGGSQ